MALNQGLQNKIINTAETLRYVNPCRCKHFSFLIQRTAILSMGMNSLKRTHTLANELGYLQNNIHSELDCILKIRWKGINYAKCMMVNIRINRFCQIRMSKPCDKCFDFLNSLNIGKIYYTKPDGKFYKLR